MRTNDFQCLMNMHTTVPRLEQKMHLVSASCLQFPLPLGSQIGHLRLHRLAAYRIFLNPPSECMCPDSPLL